MNTKAHTLFLVVSTLSHHTSFFVEGSDILEATAIATRIVNDINKDAFIKSIQQHPIVRLSE